MYAAGTAWIDQLYGVVGVDMLKAKVFVLRVFMFWLFTILSERLSGVTDRHYVAF